jgi:hypothetical protein
MLKFFVLPIAIYEKLTTFYRCRGLKNILLHYIKKFNCSEWEQVQVPGLTLLHMHQDEGDEFWTSYDEVCECFDAMGLQRKPSERHLAYGVEISYS